MTPPEQTAPPASQLASQPLSASEFPPSEVPPPSEAPSSEAPPSSEAALALRTVAVIGAGRAGRAFAIACARAGLHVVLEDVMPARLRRAQDEYAELAASGERPGSLRFALTVEDAVREADLALDFVPDELESKLEIFSLLDRMAPPRTVLCTPTLALSVTDLASCTYRAERCVGVRSTNEGLLETGSGPETGSGVPIETETPSGTPIELAQSRFVSPQALALASALWQRLGRAVRIVADADPELVRNRP